VPGPRLRARLKLIPALLALTWLVVAFVRIEQLSRHDASTSAVAQFWSIGVLTLLALLYLLYAAIGSRVHTRSTIDRAYRSVRRLEQITDISLSELPTGEMLTALIDRVRVGLGADAGILALSTDDGMTL
jgi:hypothetical protein